MFHPAKVVSVVLAFLLFAFFVNAVWFFSSTSARIASNDNVVNYRALKVSFPYKIGRSPACGETECWLLPQFDDSAWSKAAFPTVPLEKLEGYFERAAGDGIYYRFNLQVPSSLLALDELLSFSPVYINHQTFDVYLMGRLVYAHSGPSVQGRIANIPITQADIMQGRTQITIRASLAKDDIGVEHFSGIFLGPKHLLDNVIIADERANVSYFLLFLLSKGSVFIIAAFIFLLTQAQPGFFYFLAFAFFVTVEDFFRSSLFPPDVALNLKYGLYFLCRSGAQFFLLAFLLQYFSASRYKRYVNLVAALVVMGIGAHFWYVQRTGLLFNVGFFLQLDTAFVFAVLLVSIAVAMLNRAEGLRSRNSLYVVVFLGVYGLLLAFEFFFVPYLGFQKRALLDLVFFYLMSFLCIREFGVNEKLLAKRSSELAESRVQAAVGQFSQMLAHDMRKPLGMAKVFLQILKDDLPLAKKQESLQHFEPEFDKALSTADAMIQDVMEFGQKKSLSSAQFHLEKLVATILQDLGMSKYPKLTVHQDFRHGSETYGDVVKLERVLSNILQNALAVLPEQTGNIWISSQKVESQGKHYIRIDVANDGPIILPEDLPYIFEAFFSRNKTSGTGLGLTIAKKFVEDHGGHLSCESRLRDGVPKTTFTILIPG